MLQYSQSESDISDVYPVYIKVRRPTWRNEDVRQRLVSDGLYW